MILQVEKILGFRHIMNRDKTKTKTKNKNKNKNEFERIKEIYIWRMLALRYDFSSISIA